MRLNIAQVIGLNTDQKAAQVISTQIGDAAFLAVLDLTCDDAFTKGRQVLSDLSDFYFEAENPPAEKLKAVFDAAKEKFGNEEFSLLVASVSGKILYLISKGGVEVYLERADKLSTLTSVESDSSLVSGFLQDKDRLLLSTKSLAAFLDMDLEKSLKLSLETFEQDFSDRIGASHLENQGLAALAVEVGQEAIPNIQEQPFFEGQTAFDSYTTQKSNPFAILSAIASNIRKILGRSFPASGRGKLILAVVLIAVIALGVGIKTISSKNAQKEAEFNSVFQAAKDDFNTAKGLASLNPAEAKSKLESSKEKINTALSIKPKSAEALDFKKQIDSESDSILQQTKTEEFAQFLDLDLIKKDFRAQNLSLSAGKLLVMDSSVKTLAVIELTKKSNQILAGSEQLGQAKHVSLNGSMAFIFSEDKGILRIDTQNQKVTTVSKADKEWGDIKDIYGFASNIYLLDKADPSAGSGQVWKYLPTSDGYSDKREYLTKNTKMDFSNAIRMQIESSIYVLKSGGEILRFTKGEKDNFGLEGLPSNVSDPKSFFVSSDTDNLYLLDSGNSRLLILTKTGSYKGQISGSKFATASDLVVDEKEKKVYLLEGSKIYSVDLK